MLKIVAAALFTLSLLVMPAMAEEAKNMRMISISGHGEVRAAPDLAMISMGTMSQGKTAKEALDDNTKAMNDLMKVLKAAGIADNDTQTSNFNVGPLYDNSSNNGPAPQVAGYQVSNQVTITVRKLAELGAILDKAVSAGSNQINGVSFSVADSQASEDEARKAAVKEAKRKAALYAEAAGVKLGAITTISEGGNSPPVPVLMAARAMKAEASDVPVSAGEMVISADVNIVWAIE